MLIFALEMTYPARVPMMKEHAFALELHICPRACLENLICFSKQYVSIRSFKLDSSYMISIVLFFDFKILFRI